MMPRSISLTAFLILAALTLTSMGGLVRGPYLQMAHPQAMTLRWRTDVAGQGKVSYGSSPAELTSSLTGAPGQTDHEIRLTGLTPATRYYYAIEVDGTPLASGTDYHFLTPPVTGSTGAFRFWTLGDAGTADANQVAVRDAFAPLHALKPANFMLLLGDNAYGIGTDAEYQNAFYNIYPSFLRQLCVWSCLGNHETYSNPAAPPYFDMFTFPQAGECGGTASGTERYYSFDYANVHFIVIDSMQSSRLASGAQAAWLRADLEAVTTPWIIACWHHPPYDKGSHDSDAEIEQIEMRTDIVPILENGGVDLVLCGHSHVYERSWFIKNHFGLSRSFSPAHHLVQPGDGREDGNGVYQKFVNGPGAGHGTVYVVCGSSGKTGGSPLNHPAMHTSTATLGSMVIDVENNRLDAKFLTAAGTVADHFSVVKATDGPVLLPGQPVNLSALPLPGGSALLRWDDVLAETAYDVAVSNDGLVFTPSGSTEANDTSFLLNGLAEGTPVQVRVTARNPSGSNPSPHLPLNYLIPPTGRTPMEQWRFIHFSTPSASAVSGETADPDGDGYNNLLEYAVNSDPNRCMGLPPLQVVHSPVDGKLILTFHRAPRPELTYQLQTTATLRADDWQTVYTSSGAANTETVISLADTAAPPGNQIRFCRLLVTLP
jgi:hypothetical protein